MATVENTGPRVVELSVPQAQFMRSVAPIVALIGGVGCLDPHTKIGEATIGDLSCTSVVSTLQGPAVASPSFLKGQADLYLVRTESGREVIVEEHHRFLTEAGWLPLGSLGIDSLIAVDDAEGDCQNLQTTPSSPQSCCGCSHLCGGQCTFGGVLPVGREVLLQTSVLDGACQLGLQTCHLSIESCVYHERESLRGSAFELRSCATCDAYVQQSRRTLCQETRWTPPLGTLLQSPPLVEQSQMDGGVPCRDRIQPFLTVYLLPFRLTQDAHQFECKTCPVYTTKSLDQYLRPFNDASYKTQYNPHFEKVKSISWHHYGEYYDLQVPDTGHYLASGIYHHNSGKTWAGIVKARTKIAQGLSGAIVAPDFPHFARSTWDTMEKWLPWSYCTNRDLNHPYTKEQVLRFNYNGLESKVWYGAMENVEAWTGMNLNWFFFDECRREKTRRAFDVLVSRLRVGDNAQGFLATSPLGRSHWLYDICVNNTFSPEVVQAFKKAGYEGKIVEYFKTKTKDNEKNLTATYYALLTGLYSGKLAQQELEGEFIAMEGAVWDGFNDQLGGNVTELAEYNDSVAVEWWMDDGFVHKHPRVVLFAQVIPPYINIFDEYVVEGEYPEETIAKCLKFPISERPYHRPSLALVDSTAAELRSKLWDADIDTVKASHEVEQGVLHVGPFLLDGKGMRRLRVHPRCTQTIQGVLGYMRDDDTNKLAKLGDDIADALRYGLWNKKIEDLDEEAIIGPVPSNEKVLFILPGGKKITQADIDLDRRLQNMEEMALYRWSTQYLQR